MTVIVYSIVCFWDVGWVHSIFILDRLLFDWFMLHPISNIQYLSCAKVASEQVSSCSWLLSFVSFFIHIFTFHSDRNSKSAPRAIFQRSSPKILNWNYEINSIPSFLKRGLRIFSHDERTKTNGNPAILLLVVECNRKKYVTPKTADKNPTLKF